MLTEFTITLRDRRIPLAELMAYQVKDFEDDVEGLIAIFNDVITDNAIATNMGILALYAYRYNNILDVIKNTKVVGCMLNMYDERYIVFSNIDIEHDAPNHSVISPILRTISPMDSDLNTIDYFYKHWVVPSYSNNAIESSICKLLFIHEKLYFKVYCLKIK